VMQIENASVFCQNPEGEPLRVSPAAEDFGHQQADIFPLESDWAFRI